MAEQSNTVALVGIIVKDPDAVAKLNDVLHEYAQYIIGRMGIPHREHNMSVISIVLDAPHDVVSALAGKVGNIAGVTSTAVTPKTE